MSRMELNERWDNVLADADAVAAEYQDRGWTALAVHPGDVNAITDTARLHVLLPGSEFDEANDLTDGATFDTVQVYGADAGSTRFRLVVAEDTTAEIAVCVPVFVLGTEADDLQTAADAAGGVTVRLRPLDDRDLVEFAVADPDLFFELSAGE